MKNTFEESDRDRMKRRLAEQLEEAKMELAELEVLLDIQQMFVEALEVLVAEEDEEPP